MSEDSTSVVTVAVGSRTITVECAPLLHTSWSSYRDRRLARRGDRRLLLKSTSTGCLLGLMLVVFGALSLALAIWLPEQPRGGIIRSMIRPACWTSALVFSVCGLCFVFLGRAAIRFDRDSGQMQHVAKSKSRPLSDILAVQLIHAMTHRPLRAEGSHLRTYQLNLVLDDPDEPRMNLCDNADVAWLWQAGQKIADFLERPFVDLIFGPEAEEEPPILERALPFSSVAENEGDVTITQPGANALVISQQAVSSPFITIGGLMLLAMGVTCLLLMLRFRGWQRQLDLFDLWLGFVALAPGIAVFLIRWAANRANRAEFDCVRRMLRYGGWSRRTRPFSDIVAVQLAVEPLSDVAVPPPPKSEVSLPGFHHVVPDAEAEESYRAATYSQLNLVMGDPPVRRVNLICHCDEEWALGAAHRIAEFFGVPLK